MRFTLIVSLCVIGIGVAVFLYLWEAKKIFSDSIPPQPKDQIKQDTILHSQTASIVQPVYDYPEYVTDTLNIDSIFQANGLKDVWEYDSSIKVHLRYATEDNFMNKNVYGNLRRAFLRVEVVKMLVKAQKNLKKKRPDLSIIIYDAARPQRVQFTMWKLVAGTDEQIYVAPPIPGSLHNFGCSVDVSLVDSTGQPLDMGTDYDSFDPKSEPRFERRYLKSGELTKEQIANRKILRNAMQSAGFIYMVKEWWHFDAYPPEKVVQQYKIIK